MGTTITDNNKFILLYGVDNDKFKHCFGNENEWHCEIVRIGKGVDKNEVLITYLKNPNLLSVVVTEIDNTPNWDSIVQYYKNDGGFVLFFGVLGITDDVAKIGSIIGREWKFSAYTKHEYDLTDVATHILGDFIKKQAYTKSNLVSAPVEDRLMVAETYSFDKYVQENVVYDEEEDTKEENDLRKEYDEWIEGQLNQSPLVMYQDPPKNGCGGGGKFAYMGFVNSEDKIPKIARALLTGQNFEDYYDNNNDSDDNVLHRKFLDSTAQFHGYRFLNNADDENDMVISYRKGDISLKFQLSTGTVESYLHKSLSENYTRLFRKDIDTNEDEIQLIFENPETYTGHHES